MMNYQHFSHHHILIPLSPPESGQRLICYACGNPITEADHDAAAGDGLHGCLPCRFYVHDRCLNAPRWMDHPAHRAHPLTLFPCPTYSHASFACNACGLPGDRSCFGCAKCEFDLHLRCATLPESVLIDAHPDHHLKLYYEFPDHNPSLSCMCDVCGGNVDTRFWIYKCTGCGFDCHVDCAMSSRRCPSYSSSFAQSQLQAPPQPAQPYNGGAGGGGGGTDDVESSMVQLIVAQNELKLAEMRTQMLAQQAQFTARINQSILDSI